MKTRTGIQPDEYPNLAVGKATADANGNVIPDTYALLPTSVTDTGRASGQWVVGTDSTPGGKTMLLGTFGIYDTNIWLHISGGFARGGSSNNTTDVNVFISSLQGTVNEAYCYVRKLYKSDRTQGIYYTVDSSRNLHIYAAVPQFGKMFVSAEVSGGSIVGKGSSEDATPSGGQYIPEKNYADLSQVVRTDATQSLTDAQKQQALENVGQNTATSDTSRVLATYAFGTGYSTYVRLGTFYVGDSNIEIDINSGLGAKNTSGKIILVTTNGFIDLAEGRWDQKADNIEFWYDVRDKEGNFSYIDLYCNNVPYGKIYCTVRATGASLIEKANNVSSLPSTKVALNDTFRFIGSAPTWVTGTSGSITLPSSGWYYLQASSNSTFSNLFGNSGIVYVDITKFRAWFPLPQDLNPDSSYSIESLDGTLYARTGSDTSTWYIRYYKLA